MAVLEETLQEDRPASESAQAAQRQQLVTKVFLTELGTTDFARTSLVLAAMPTVGTGAEPTARELDELARFLDEHVKALRE